MSSRAPLTGATDYVGLSKCTCPLCGDSLIRVSRRPVDRLLSLFGSKHRYRCRGFACQWEGNMRASDHDPNPIPGSQR